MKFHLNKRTAILALCIFSIVLVFFAFYRNQKPTYDPSSYALDKYTIIRDDHQTKILIGVAPTIDEESLLRTLTKAADENQSYSKRDYMLSSYLWVEAYLVDGNLQSKVPAGKLRRYMPPINGETRKSLFDLIVSIILPRNDSFSVTLQEAHLSMKQSN